MNLSIMYSKKYRRGDVVSLRKDIQEYIIKVCLSGKKRPVSVLLPYNLSSLTFNAHRIKEYNALTIREINYYDEMPLLEFNENPGVFWTTDLLEQEKFKYA